MDSTCKLCNELFQDDMKRYLYEDDKGCVYEVCGVCKEDLNREEDVA